MPADEVRSKGRLAQLRERWGRKVQGQSEGDDARVLAAQRSERRPCIDRRDRRDERDQTARRAMEGSER